MTQNIHENNLYINLLNTIHEIFADVIRIYRWINKISL